MSETKQEPCECPARKALEAVARNVIPEVDLADAVRAALSTPCPCEQLRRYVHFLAGHNQFFERCESGWCHPSPDADPASVGFGKAWKTPAEYEAERDSLRSLLDEAREAIVAVTTMWDRGPEPRKLDAALSWRENDERARGMAAAVLAKIDAARKVDR